MKKRNKFPKISNEFTDCALPLTGDIYNLCSFKCCYCFSSLFHFWNPQCRYKKPVLKKVDIEYLINLFEGKYKDNPYYENFIKKRFLLHLGSLSEPFDYLERKEKTGLEFYNYLASIKYPTLFSTKGISLFLKDKSYLRVFEKAAKTKNFAFQFSITTNSDRTASIIEKGVPSTSERLRAMKMLSDMGFMTILRLRPFIIGITDDELEELLERAKKAGAYSVSAEFLCIDKRALNFEGLNTFSKLLDYDYTTWYRKLSPPERGTYMRLNRYVKRYFVERLLKRCKDLDLRLSISGADFKELGFSTCCCGLPEKNPVNSELENFSYKQMTSILIKAHREWLKNPNKEIFVYFDDMRDDKYGNWMNEHRYWGDSIVCYQSDYARLYTGHNREFLDVWNSLSTPRNPYRYFDGLLYPVGVDKNKNMIYRYNPPSFYYRWKEEGII